MADEEVPAIPALSLLQQVVGPHAPPLGQNEPLPPPNVPPNPQNIVDVGPQPQQDQKVQY